MAHQEAPGRPRFYLWIIFGISIWAAAACWTVRTIQAYRQAPYLEALKEEQAWIVQSVGQAARRPDSIGDKMASSGHQILVGPPSSPCLVKLSWITWLDAKSGARYSVRKEILAEGACRSYYREPRAVKSGGTDLNPTQFARLRAILAKMPTAPKAVDPRDALLVGYAEPKGRWTTARYDFRRPPSEIREIGELLR